MNDVWARIADELVLPRNDDGAIVNHDGHRPDEPKGGTPEAAAGLFPVGYPVDPETERRTLSAAVGPVDDDQLYYLATRGVPPDEAERLIVLGFFDDVFDRLPVRSLVAPLRRSVVEKIEHRDPIARDSKSGARA